MTLMALRLEDNKMKIIMSIINRLAFINLETTKGIALQKVVKANSVVVDIGSHNGDFIAMIQKMKLHNEFFSVEPQADRIEHQRRRFKDVPKIQFHNIAIHEKSGQETFFVSKGDDGSSLLRPVDGIGSKWATTVGEMQITTVTLREFILSNGIKHISLLKCDTQGTDLRVIASAAEFFTPLYIQAILIEISLHSFYVDQDKFSEIIDAFYERGYFLAEIFGYRNFKGWLWSIDALFLPIASEYTT